MFLPGESHGQMNLVGYSPWDCTESDMNELLSTAHLVIKKAISVDHFAIY